MADKSFGVKDVNLIGASGTPTIDSPNNLNINAVNVAISTDMSIGGNLTVTGSITGSVGSLVNLGTIATNTGTEAAFTNIPSTAKKITVVFTILVQAGTNSELVCELVIVVDMLSLDINQVLIKNMDYQMHKVATNSYGVIDDTNARY